MGEVIVYEYTCHIKEEETGAMECKAMEILLKENKNNHNRPHLKIS